MDSYTTPSYLLPGRWMPYIPRAKARGFTARLLNLEHFAQRIFDRRQL
jgi:hypothetical protein